MGRAFLNVDAGELPDEPAELYALAHLVNVACGGHAGDAASMARVLEACKLHGTLAGAHPSYPDREGFGRTKLAMDPGALRESVRSQCAALADVARSVGVTLTHAKPHGALYHAANGDHALAEATLRGIRDALGTVTVLGPAKGALADAAMGLEMKLASEGFADRGVRPDGSLVPRGEPGAMIHDPAAAAARALQLRSSVETICVHGDGENALAVARAVREVLDAQAR